MEVAGGSGAAKGGKIVDKTKFTIRKSALVVITAAGVALVVAGVRNGVFVESWLEWLSTSLRLERAARAVENPSRTETREQQKLMEASARFMRKMEIYERAYYEASANIPMEEIISPIGITDLAQIREYVRRVKHFLKLNEDLRNVIASGPALLRQELEKEELPASTIDSALEAYESAYDPRREIMREIREHDAAIGANLLSLLDLYEVHWGAWDSWAEEEMRFIEGTELGEKYSQAINGIMGASASQQAAQERLVSLGEANKSGS